MLPSPPLLGTDEDPIRHNTTTGCGRTAASNGILALKSPRSQDRWDARRQTTAQCSSRGKVGFVCGIWFCDETKNFVATAACIVFQVRELMSADRHETDLESSGSRALTPGTFDWHTEKYIRPSFLSLRIAVFRSWTSRAASGYIRALSSIRSGDGCSFAGPGGLSISECEESACLHVSVWGRRAMQEMFGGDSRVSN